MKRPSWKECTNKIRNAVELVSNGKIKTIDPSVIASDAIDLGYQIKDLRTTLLSVLDEIRSGDYAGTRPPQKSYKVEIMDSELFAFRWRSKLFGCKTDIKFCFKNNCLYLVSLHCDRERKEIKMEKEKQYCPNDHGLMTLKNIEKTITFRGKEISYQAELFVCEECGKEVGTIEQTAAIQNAISDAYREKMGLLTGTEIREKRKKFCLSQKELAERAGVGIASIKRWENGIIQTKSMDKSLRTVFQNRRIGSNITGNRALSIPRVKLVMKEFEKETGQKFLEDGDMMLFDAKYLCYADMMAYNRIGKSLTGATYAALPHGPQLNNYKELIDLIRDSDETKAEPLTDEEKRIIIRVSLSFPQKQSVYDAVHREKVWKNKPTGSIIPYTDAAKITEIRI